MNCRQSSFATMLVAVSSMLAAPALAHDVEEHIGPDHNQIEGVRLDVHADFGSYGAFGAGLRADIPIVPNGIIDGVMNDEIAFSPGVEVFFLEYYGDRYVGGPYFMPLAMLQWNFYIGDDWSVFPEAGIALYAGNADYLPRGHGGVYAAFATGIGARYHFSPRNSVLLRASWPAGLQVGLTF
jgi:hypothetical protein